MSFKAINIEIQAPIKRHAREALRTSTHSGKKEEEEEKKRKKGKYPKTYMTPRKICFLEI